MLLYFEAIFLLKLSSTCRLFFIMVVFIFKGASLRVYSSVCHTFNDSFKSLSNIVVLVVEKR